MKFETALRKLSEALEDTPYTFTEEEGDAYLGYKGTAVSLPIYKDVLKKKMDLYGPSAMIRYVKEDYAKALYPDKEELLNRVHFSLRAKDLIESEENYPYCRAFADLMALITFDADYEGGTSVLPVRKEYMELIGISSDQLEEAAGRNTEERFRMPKLDAFSGPVDTHGMFLITNNTLIDGAGSILCIEKDFKKIEHPENGIVLIPTSVHEIIVYEDNGFRTIDEAQKMIQDVNETNRFIKNDYLSDKVYKMDRDGKVTILR